MLAVWRAREPITVYAAAAAPPTRASASPSSASVDRLKSTPVTTSTPPKASARPTSTRTSKRSPRTSCHATIHASWRQTIAVADATDVSVRDVTQVAKWIASMTPDSSTRPRRRPVSSRRSPPRRATTAGAIATVANALRQNAMASGGTTASAINGPDSETATTATAISRSVRSGPVTPAIIAEPGQPAMSGTVRVASTPGRDQCRKSTLSRYRPGCGACTSRS